MSYFRILARGMQRQPSYQTLPKLDASALHELEKSAQVKMNDCQRAKASKSSDVKLEDRVETTAKNGLVNACKIYAAVVTLAHASGENLQNRIELANNMLKNAICACYAVNSLLAASEQNLAQIAGESDSMVDKPPVELCQSHVMRAVNATTAQTADEHSNALLRYAHKQFKHSFVVKADVVTGNPFKPQLATQFTRPSSENTQENAFLRQSSALSLRHRYKHAYIARRGPARQALSVRNKASTSVVHSTQTA